MSLLQSWTRASHETDGVAHDIYRKGSGPGVVVVHEVPGITPDVIAFAEAVVAQGHTVVMPHLFGPPEVQPTIPALARGFATVCIRREFTKLALNETAPIATWLRSLAADLNAELGGPGVGAVGMCFTGGLALAMMVDPSVVAPVVAQPSAPFPFGRERGADLNLSPSDLETVRRRAREGCAVLGLRFRDDTATGTRFDTLRHELGDNFLAVEFDGKGHSTLTEHRQEEAVDRVLAFLKEKLIG